ncbi:MAG: tyrosine-type recombinase/integrase [Solirubrobacteraceae bacterium]
MGSVSGFEMAGPLAPFASGFGVELVRLGYRPRSACEQLRLMADASGWLADHGLGSWDLTEVRVAELIAARGAAGRSRLLSRRAMAPLLRYLRGVGVVPVAVAAMSVTASEVLLERYRAFLRERRGLSSSTERNYVGVAGVFLSWRETTAGTLALGELDGAAVIAFVLGESQRCSVGSAKCLVTRLRAFLRFLYVEGETCRDLAGVVLSVASWRLAGLVKALDGRSVAALLASCDRRTGVGRRDFAVITLLSRLGLRAGEVAALRLADIDWRSGELLVRGKGSRQECLPLPSDVGEALAGWLSRGRSRCDSVFVFTSVRPPHGAISATAVSQIVRRACRRAGLSIVGAHRLRHTAATEMLRAGGSLTEVGQVLRHRSRDVTSIYAKVDRSALAQVVMRWPGAVA